MDTNINESFNNTFAWLAPKNKVYCGTQSLINRLSMGIGIQGLGLLEYFRRLFKKLGVVVTPNILHFLSVKQAKRAKQNYKVKQNETKKQCLQSKFEQLRKDEATAKKERAKREGYKTGVNLEDENEEQTTNNNKQQSNNKPIRRTVVCSHCGKKGHSTTRSKKCLKHKDNIDKSNNNASNNCINKQQEAVVRGTPEPALASSIDHATAIAADDVDNMDTMPLLDDPEDSSDSSDFYECMSSFESDVDSGMY